METKNQLGVGFLLGLAFFGAAAAAGNSGWQRFSCPGGKFSLELPAAWQALCDVPDIILAAAGKQEGPDDQYIENLTIAAVPNVPPRTMEDFIELYLVFLAERIDGFEFVSSRPIRIDGRSARKLIFFRNLGTEKVKVMQALVMKGEEIFVLNFSDSPDTFDRREPDFERAALSLKFE